MAEIGTAYIDVVPRFDPDIPRIQILELPMEHAGDYASAPFALIVDGANLDGEDIDLEALRDFKDAVGARAVLVTKGRFAV